MSPRESYFIVLSDQPDTLPSVMWPGSGREAEISGSWDVYFSSEWGGPGHVTFHELTDWTAHADPRIKYYSGTAIYRNRFSVHRNIPEEKVFLKLSALGAAARIVVNGVEVATVWCSPWEADLTDVVREGDNEVEINVVNSLMNRMIGDASLPADQRVTYAYPEIAEPEDALVPSGLVGVSLLYRNE